MKTTTEDTALDAAITALRATDPSPARVEAAQAALRERVDAALRRESPTTGDPATTGRAPTGSRFRYAWLGAAAALVVALVPMLVSQPASAFAKVQQALGAFERVEMKVVTRTGDEVLSTMTILADHDGNSRTTIGEQLTTIVNVHEKKLVQLSHEDRSGYVMSIPIAPGGDALRAIDEVRNFQGVAEPLPARAIDGVSAQGHRLVGDDATIEIWSRADGMPLAMQVDSGGVTLDFAFDFTPAFGPEVFAAELPPGYSNGSGETE